MPPPDPAAPAGELGFKFDRSGYRVPAILVSPWIPQGSVFNDEYRHTSLIATLRKAWELGEPLTQRDAAARTFDDLFTLDEPRDPGTWATVTALPVPAWHLDEEALGKGLSGLGKSMGHGHHRTRQGARAHGSHLELDDPAAEVTAAVILDVFRHVAWHYFPLLSPARLPETQRAEPLAARDPDARACGSDCRGCTEHRPGEPVVRLHRGQRDHERGQEEAAERERADGGAAPPVQLLLGSDLPPLVDRPGRQLAGEEKQDGHDRRARVDPVSGCGNRGDVGAAGEEERDAESRVRRTESAPANSSAPATAPGTNDGNRRRRTRERVREDASIGGGRSDGERYAGRARCLNAFTSSRGTASGSSSRQVTTGTPTCS